MYNSKQAPNTNYGASNRYQNQSQGFQNQSGLRGSYNQEPQFNVENQASESEEEVLEGGGEAAYVPPPNPGARQPSKQQYRPQPTSYQSQQQAGSFQSRQSGQGLQRSSFPQQQGVQRSAAKEQAVPVAGIQTNKNDDSEERRQNILCFLFVTLFLVVVVIIAMAIFLTLWLSADDNENTPVMVNSTGPPPETNRSRDVGPTPSPVTGSSRWTVRSELEIANGPQVDFGTVVAMAGNFLAVGVPGFDDSAGRIDSYQQSNASQSFSPMSVASARNTGEFGMAIDMAVDSNNVPNVLVGATKSFGGQESTVRFGSAHYFRFDGTAWQPVGDAIRGLESVQEAGGLMGDAVAMAATINRVAVAAPSSSIDDNNYNTGRVFTFELSGSTWNRMTAAPLQGTAESYFGQCLDMSDDGSTLLVGAPGTAETPANGKIAYYQWNSGSSTWTEVFSLEGSNSESLGSAVKIIKSDGSQFAAGSRNMNSGSGGIRVFGLNATTGEYDQIGDDIVGQSSDERVGSTLGGADGLVTFGTDTGRILVYEFDGTSWTRDGDSPDAGSPVVSIAMSDDGNTVAAGLADGNVIVYGRTAA
ncbi:hypothetical protein ACA910_003919 [Epithemia clementina (nom. ined.)]